MSARAALRIVASTETAPGVSPRARRGRREGFAACPSRGLPAAMAAAGARPIGASASRCWIIAAPVAAWAALIILGAAIG